jgi:16S rRNA (guanine527-N7)-methyltransferase
VTSSEFSERLLALAAKTDIVVPPSIVEPLGVYFELLSRWNAKINLTSLPLAPASDDAFERLLLEPLAAAPYIPDIPQNWFDIGSGGGSPAIPLKLARPAPELHLVESTGKKAAFLRETIRELRLTGADVFGERLEDLVTRPGMRHVAALITIRAVRMDQEILRAARQLVVEKGQLLIFCRTEPGEGAPWFSHESTVLLGGSHGARLARYTTCVPRGTNQLTF